MITDIGNILGLGNESSFIVVWIALLLLSIFIYELFSVLLVIFRRFQ